jgi:hypothetical protein
LSLISNSPTCQIQETVIHKVYICVSTLNLILTMRNNHPI